METPWVAQRKAWLEDERHPGLVRLTRTYVRDLKSSQGSKDSESDEDDIRPVSHLVLFWSADPHLLYKPFQTNTMKELVNFSPQVPYLLKTNGRDFVLEKAFVHLLGFFFKVFRYFSENLKFFPKI